MAEVILEHVWKIYDGKVAAVKDVNLEIRDREFMVLVGPSGCGKSTTLRMIAGLEEISKGEVKIGDRVVNNVAPKDRDIAMVFQNYALYPHMSVYDNMAFGLKLRNFSKEDIDYRVKEAAKILGLEEYLERRPKQLSGGQRQRVAIVRALMMNPEILLLDEVTASLDPEMVREVLDVVLELARTGMTMLIVTHEMGFARAIADRIVFMDEGRIVEVDPPRKFFADPSSDRARKFLDIFSFEGAKL